MNTRVPAEVFPPGEFLKDELDARGWTQVEFAEIIERDTRIISEIITGKRSITPETAIALGEALGTGPEFWLNLESQYQLSKVRPKENFISRKAKLHDRFPVREMVKRGWVDASQNIDLLENQVFKFFNITSINDSVQFSHAAKKTSYDSQTMLQHAWLFRVKSIAKTLLIEPYSEKKLKAVLENLSSLLLSPEEIRHVPKLLADCGVRFIIVEALPGSKIDGACFWLDKDSPVIGMTTKKDTIDNFWFVLRHEIEHVLLKHGQDKECLDEDLGLETEDIPPEEKLANRAGAQFCVPQDQLANFYDRVNPFFSDQKVTLFAKKLNLHPGLVVGQLQRRLNNYAFLKKYQVKVRHIITSSAVTDGFGQIYPL
ncbi:HTH-type transcriptional regulator/antitoxin HigA [Methylovorus glucosotrophus]|uniref:HigA family addiction module antitoxin n=1 Tax=Methylovorus glucosotrophus TaxID=266009 RepID=UPI001331B864|nr:HigA family addiction module antitoxin [Methylovorus glucosotrophus]KAF0844263.1 HTH-type transcriptional regulator/antitoxin HigA [Methylovorus glucosotrophus]